MRLDKYIGALELIIACISLFAFIFYTIDYSFDMIAGVYLLLVFLTAFNGINHLGKR